MQNFSNKSGLLNSYLLKVVIKCKMSADFSSISLLATDISPIEYVPLSDTIADITLREKASASLTTTSTILLSVLVILTFGINLILLATILSRLF